MPLLATWLIMLFAILYFMILMAECIGSRSLKKVLPELLLLAGFLLLLHFLTGFPTAASRKAFGGVFQLTALGLMFICTIIGITTHYLFHLKGKFSWKSFLKPLVISPIVFLPLIGSVQSMSELESVQMITFAVLSFQNVFFWKDVFAGVKEKI